MKLIFLVLALFALPTENLPIRNFLDACNLLVEVVTEYEKKFMEEEVTVKMICEMSDEDLKSLRVRTFCQRFKIRKKAEELKQNMEVADVSEEIVESNAVVRENVDEPGEEISENEEHEDLEDNPQDAEDSSPDEVPFYTTTNWNV